MKFVLASLFYLVCGIDAFYSSQMALQFCEYWQHTPLYKELKLDSKCTKMVFSDHKKVRN